MKVLLIAAGSLITTVCYALPYTETDSATAGNSAAYDGNISATDLLEGLTPSSTVGSGDGGTPLSALNDGAASDGFIVGGNTNDLWFGNGYLGAGSELASSPILTYSLGSSLTGYTITSFNSINGYGGPYSVESAADQSFTLSYSTIAAPSTFLTLGTVNYSPFTDAEGGGASTQVTLSSIVGLVGVADLQFQFTPLTGQSAGEVIREIDVSGGVTSIPEPSTYAMIGLGLLALIGIRRFRQLSA